MEPVSFALAVAGIPGAFTASVNCFKYIQFGRDFENDFEKTWCQLEASEMRLTRWGASMGIGGPETKFRSDGYDEEEVKTAYRWLLEIQQAFNSAMQTSARYGRIAKPDKLQPLDTDAQLCKGSEALQTLHKHMRRIVDRRVKPRVRDRITWALYQKGAFQNLIETISALTSQLVELFPPTHDAQKQMCKSEVGGLDRESLALLNEAIGDDDEMLKGVLRAEAQQRPNLFSNIEVKDYARGQYGDIVKEAASARSTVVRGVKAGGHSVTHFGNVIGYAEAKTVFGAPGQEDVPGTQ